MSFKYTGVASPLAKHSRFIYPHQTTVDTQSDVPDTLQCLQASRHFPFPQSSRYNCTSSTLEAFEIKDKDCHYY